MTDETKQSQKATDPAALLAEGIQKLKEARQRYAEIYAEDATKVDTLMRISQLTSGIQQVEAAQTIR